jgi:hypothetical protein
MSSSDSTLGKRHSCEAEREPEEEQEVKRGCCPDLPKEEPHVLIVSIDEDALLCRKFLVQSSLFEDMSLFLENGEMNFEFMYKIMKSVTSNHDEEKARVSKQVFIQAFALFHHGIKFSSAAEVYEGEDFWKNDSELRSQTKKFFEKVEKLAVDVVLGKKHPAASYFMLMNDRN